LWFFSCEASTCLRAWPTAYKLHVRPSLCRTSASEVVVCDLRRDRLRKVVIYFKFRENRLRGLGAVEGRKSPSSIDLAYGLYKSLYYRTSRDVPQSMIDKADQWRTRRLVHLKAIILKICYRPLFIPLRSNGFLSEPLIDFRERLYRIVNFL